MKRLLLLSLISFYMYAGDLESYNLKVKSESNVAGNIETEIESTGGMSLSIRSKKKLTEEQEDLVGRTYITFFNWKELNIESAKLVFEGRKLSIIFQIKDLTYNDVEISRFMPSGIQLYYDTFYEYDFRMFKDGLFMRLKGQYYSKAEFLEELYNAVVDPILYVQIHDPSYIIRQIDQLRTQNQEQDKGLFELLEKNNELLEKHSILQQNHNELQEKHNQLQADHLKQTDIQDRLKDGIISLSNKSFFGSLNAFDKTNVEQIIEIKESTPAYTVKEVVAALKLKEIKVSSKVVEGVFIIYFDEFPQNVK